MMKRKEANVMKATEKDVGIDNFLTFITGRDRKEVVSNSQCATCDDPDTDFRDSLSAKEYTISGMCQTCQDSVFGE